MTSEAFIDYRELAAATGVKRGTLKRWKHEGMPAHQFGERVRFLLSEVKSWIAARRADPVKVRRIRDCTFDRESVVYFGIMADGTYKIGWTSDTKRRAYEEDFTPLASLPGDKRIESLFHEVFRADRIDGERERFRPSPRLTAFVDGLIAMQTKVAA